MLHNRLCSHRHRRWNKSFLRTSFVWLFSTASLCFRKRWFLTWKILIVSKVWTLYVLSMAKLYIKVFSCFYNMPQIEVEIRLFWFAWKNNTTMLLWLNWSFFQFPSCDLLFFKICNCFGHSFEFATSIRISTGFFWAGFLTDSIHNFYLLPLDR